MCNFIIAFRRGVVNRNAAKNKRRMRIAHPPFVGADNRIRTDDLVITNDVLYRLSYISKRRSQRRIVL